MLACIALTLVAGWLAGDGEDRSRRENCVFCVRGAQQAKKVAQHDGKWHGTAEKTNDSKTIISEYILYVANGYKKQALVQRMGHFNIQCSSQIDAPVVAVLYYRTQSEYSRANNYQLQYLYGCEHNTEFTIAKQNYGLSTLLD